MNKFCQKPTILECEKWPEILSGISEQEVVSNSLPFDLGLATRLALTTRTGENTMQAEVSTALAILSY